MRYLAVIPLLCAGAISFCLTVFQVDAETAPPTLSPSARVVDIDPVIAEERAARASRRAFYTAPPVIPHELFPASAGDCLTCHREEGIYFGKVSSKTPHPELVNCNQCHLPSRPAFAEVEAESPPTTWKGLESPTDGTRAHVVAPPTMPHRKLLREDCQSCHSAQSPFASMRGPHPERSSCTQCHVAVSNHEFRIDHSALLPTR